MQGKLKQRTTEYIFFMYIYIYVKKNLASISVLGLEKLKFVLGEFYHAHE